MQVLYFLNSVIRCCSCLGPIYCDGRLQYQLMLVINTNSSSVRLWPKQGIIMAGKFQLVFSKTRLLGSRSLFSEEGGLMDRSLPCVSTFHNMRQLDIQTKHICCCSIFIPLAHLVIFLILRIFDYTTKHFSFTSGFIEASCQIYFFCSVNSQNLVLNLHPQAEVKAVFLVDEILAWTDHLKGVVLFLRSLSD